MSNNKNETISKKKLMFDKIVFCFYIVLLILAICFTSFVWFQKTYFVSYWVNGQSMWPTLNSLTKTSNGVLFNETMMSMNGATDVDFVIGDNHKNIMNKIDRFDIVVCKYNDDDYFDKIKRVIVLPGETFYIESKGRGRENNGNLYIQNKETQEFELINQPIDNKYIIVGDYPYAFSKPTTLADDEYFVMGDNRAHSSDSRQNGAVKKNNLEAKAIALVARCKTIIKPDSSGFIPVDINFMWPRFF